MVSQNEMLVNKVLSREIPLFEALYHASLARKSVKFWELLKKKTTKMMYNKGMDPRVSYQR